MLAPGLFALAAGLKIFVVNQSMTSRCVCLLQEAVSVSGLQQWENRGGDH